MKYAFPKKKMGVHKGFTLVELMVSLAVFSVVMLIATGVLLIMIDVNAKGQALYSAYNNLAFALDSMTREIRTGENYYCPVGIPNDFPSDGSVRNCATGSMIVFNRGWDETQVGYRLNNSRIEQKVGGGTWMPITAPEVAVQSFVLGVQGTASSDDVQPYVTVSVGGQLYNGLNQPTAFQVSTRIVQRILDRE